MKKILVFVCSVLPFIANSQYSSYYNVDVNSNSRVSGNINVNKNVNVSGYTTQTINTIDYGALANANAVRERNRIEQNRIAIEQAKYNDEKERQRAIIESKKALEIAENPMKAHDYGQFYSFTNNYLTKNFKGLLNFGFKSYTESFVIPHKSLFQNVGKGRFENISPDGITTEIIGQIPFNKFRGEYKDYESMQVLLNKHNRMNLFYALNNKPKKKDYKNNKEEFSKDLKRYYSVCDSLDNLVYNRYNLKAIVNIPRITEGKKFADKKEELFDSSFCHKKKLVKRTVYGQIGYRGTLIWENDLEIGITDNYIAFNNNVEYYVKVRYKADKESDVSFQDLEGRRYYLSKYIDKHVATKKLSNVIKVESLDPYLPKRRKYGSKAEFDVAMKLYWKN